LVPGGLGLVPTLRSIGVLGAPPSAANPTLEQNTKKFDLLKKLRCVERAFIARSDWPNQGENTGFSCELQQFSRGKRKWIALLGLWGLRKK
jgi:hypothetical protein